MSVFSEQATAIFKSKHPEQTSGPNGSSLDIAASRGATPEQAADAAWYFYTNAEFPDGTIYGSAYNCESLDKGGANDGYAYGYTPAAFNLKFRKSDNLENGETQDMLRRASIPGTPWERSIEIDPFLDYNYAKAHHEAKTIRDAGAASNTATRIAALEAAVTKLQAKIGN